jgi:hypothetical protein
MFMFAGRRGRLGEWAPSLVCGGFARRFFFNDDYL